MLTLTACLMWVTPAHAPSRITHVPVVRTLGTLPTLYTLPHVNIASRGASLGDATSDENVQSGSPWFPCIATWYSMGTTTRDGQPVRDNYTVAVDPTVIPLGSHIVVRFSDGRIRDYVADDTGSAIIGDHIDIYDSDNTQCVLNGVQHVDVRILS